MNNYHPDAHPDFVAMDSHYSTLSDRKFLQAIHESFDLIGLVTLETDTRDFCFALWNRGYKIVPLDPQQTMVYPLLDTTPPLTTDDSQAAYDILP